MQYHRPAALLGLFVLALACLAILPGRAIAQGTQFNCTLTGYTYGLESFQPISGITLLALPGTSTLSGAGGAWSLTSASGPVTLRISTGSDIIVLLTSNENPYDYYLIDAGITDLVGIVSGCRLLVFDVVEQARQEVAVPRPAAPALPAGFVPAPATLQAAVSPYAQGNAANVPWLGFYWLSAPVVRWGICGIFDVRRTSVIELAMQRWQSTPGFDWRLVRDDTTCNDDSPMPKLVIREETIQSRFTRFILGGTSAVDLDGTTCKVDGAGSACWVGRVQVRLNPPGFDRLTQDAQIATVMHEVGHAFGLHHARFCGGSIMWYSTGCTSAPLLYPGVDDIASLNELLIATLKALQAAAPSAPAVPASPGATPPTDQ